MQRELEGLVVRSVKYGDTSLILDIYTAEHGLETFIVGGARKRKSRMPASLFQLMHWVRIVCYHSDNKPMHRIKDASSLLAYTQLPFDLQRRSIGLFMLEIVQKTSHGRDANAALYEMLLNTFKQLDLDSSFINVHLHFLIDYAGFLGIGLQENWSVQHPYFDKQAGVFRSEMGAHSLSKEESRFLHQLITKDASLKLKNGIRQKLIDELIHFYSLHLDQFKQPKCLEILKLVML